MLYLACLSFSLIFTPTSAIDPLDLSGCGTTKGCVTSPKDCKADCHMAFTYSTDSSGDTTLEIYANLLSDAAAPGAGSANQYIAVGFSSDKLMGDDTVIQCSHSEFEIDPPTEGERETGSLSKVSLSKNVGKNNEYIAAIAGVNEEHSYSEVGLLCRIKGKKLTLDSFGEADGSQKYPLSGQKHILLATGKLADPKQGTQVTRHTLTTSSSEFPVVSETKVEIFEDFNSMTTPEPEPDATTKAGLWVKSGWGVIAGMVFASLLF